METGMDRVREVVAADKRKIIWIILILWTLWSADWLLNCCGSTGELVGYYYSTTVANFWYRYRTFRFIPHHTVGLMWLREGQSVEFNYQAKLDGLWIDYSHIGKSPSFVGGVLCWFGPLEDWPFNYMGNWDAYYDSEARLSIPDGTGSFTRVARKTGFHVLNRINETDPQRGSFTVSWRVVPGD